MRDEGMERTRRRSGHHYGGTFAALRATGEQVYTIGAIAPRGEGAAVLVA